MSKFEFKLPDIGEGVSEGEIQSWLVKLGDVVVEDQDMVEVMTDKATVVIPAPAAGTIVALNAKEGETVPVGTVIVVIESSAGAAAPAPEAAKPAVASAVGDIKEDLPGMKPAAAAPTAPGQQSEKPLAAPATRKLARELGLDLRQVPPTGEAGRVTREDVHAFAAAGSKPTPGPSASLGIAGVAPPRPVPAVALEERLPIKGIRKKIYESMARSKHTAAHFTYVDECECTSLIALRTQLKPLADKRGVKLSFLPFIVKAAVAALKKYPAMNCLVDDTTMEMVLRKSYDIGVAVATDAGLIVPVLRNADRLTLVEIAREIERLANEARAGKASPKDLGGASFTITSLGKVGGLLATPVVNYPEVAILFVPEMKKKPVVIGDEIKIGHVMALSLSFDHRIIDGHIGAAFTQEIIDLLQDPNQLILEL
jgi:pyruvate dehydrogenase E2 component (dihydrolipoamide acetyltransferase)